MKILVVDDDFGIRVSLQVALQTYGHEALIAASGEEALQTMKNFGIDVLLTDFNMGSGMNGIELMQKTREINSKTQMILMTGFSSINSAVAAGRLGVVEYLAKPLDLEFLNQTLKRVQEIQSLREGMKFISEASRLKTYNSKMQRVIDSCKKIAKTNATVLLTGESGTGKSMLAKVIHEESDRANKPFVNVNCATLSENLLESEIFGHVKGSFTGALKDKVGLFESANGGTIFLDEIAEISTSLQTKLLRFLQDHEFERVGDTKTMRVNIRIVAATNKNLNIEVEAGRFREDLYHRLNVIDIHAPTLRERAEDIEHLAETYLGKAFTINGSPYKPLSTEAMDALKSYSWPGNVRELENALTKAAIMCTSDQVQIGDLPDRIAFSFQKQSETGSSNFTVSDIRSQNLEDMEKIKIKEALDSSRTIDEAASRLGINASTLWRKRKKYCLE